jgi:hypothetical protein
VSEKAEIARVCRLCRTGLPSPDGKSVLCPKKGPVPPDFHCRRFKYDPLKRVPESAPHPMEFSPEEFEL